MSSNKKQQLRAFHNDPKIKKLYLKRVKQHYKLDEIVKGQYWQDGKGCAVGCIIHSNKHIGFETELGLPEWFAHLIDYLFERLENGKAKEFPLQIIKSINVGANYDIMYHEFCIFLLEEVCKWDKKKFPNVTKNIETILIYHKKIVETNNLDSVSDGEWSAVRSAVRSVARSAVNSVARSAVNSVARSAVDSVADSAAWSAADPTVWSTADRAAWAAVDSVADSVAWSATSSAAIQKIADKLIELLKKYK